MNRGKVLNCDYRYCRKLRKQEKMYDIMYKAGIGVALAGVAAVDCALVEIVANYTGHSVFTHSLLGNLVGWGFVAIFFGGIFSTSISDRNNCRIKLSQLEEKCQANK